MAHEVTRLLERWNGGDQSALDDLMPVVYSDLHRLAVSYVAREAGRSTVTPTLVINELYLKLAQQHSVRFEDRLHFFGAALPDPPDSCGSGATSTGGKARRRASARYSSRLA